MNPYSTGSPFHGEFYSTDASAPANEAAARISLYGAAGAGQIASLNANDIAVVTDIKIMVGSSAITVQVYDGSDATVDNGDKITEGDYPANGGEFQHAYTPHFCQAGTFPKVRTSGAGAVRVQIRGYLHRKGS